MCTNELSKSFSYPKNNRNNKEKGSPIQVLPHHIERVSWSILRHPLIFFDITTIASLGKKKLDLVFVKTSACCLHGTGIIENTITYT